MKRVPSAWPPATWHETQTLKTCGHAYCSKYSRELRQLVGCAAAWHAASQTGVTGFVGSTGLLRSTTGFEGSPMTPVHAALTSTAGQSRFMGASVPRP